MSKYEIAQIYKSFGVCVFVAIWPTQTTLTVSSRAHTNSYEKARAYLGSWQIIGWNFFKKFILEQHDTSYSTSLTKQDRVWWITEFLNFVKWVI